MKKILIAFYTRTNATRSLVKTIAGELNEHYVPTPGRGKNRLAPACDLVEYTPKRHYSGIFGFLRALSETSKDKVTELNEYRFDFAEYDAVIFCGPVWGGKLSVPLRSFLVKNQPKNWALCLSCSIDKEDLTAAKDEAAAIVGSEPMSFGAVARGCENFDKRVRTFCAPIIEKMGE